MLPALGPKVSSHGHLDADSPTKWSAQDTADDEGGSIRPDTPTALSVASTPTSLPSIPNSLQPPKLPDLNRPVQVARTTSDTAESLYKYSQQEGHGSPHRSALGRPQVRIARQHRSPRLSLDESQILNALMKAAMDEDDAAAAGMQRRRRDSRGVSSQAIPPPAPENVGKGPIGGTNGTHHGSNGASVTDTFHDELYRITTDRLLDGKSKAFELLSYADDASFTDDPQQQQQQQQRGDSVTSGSGRRMSFVKDYEKSNERLVTLQRHNRGDVRPPPVAQASSEKLTRLSGLLSSLSLDPEPRMHRDRYPRDKMPMTPDSVYSPPAQPLVAVDSKLQLELDREGIDLIPYAAPAPLKCRSDGHPLKIQSLYGISVKYLLIFARYVARHVGSDGGPEGLPIRSISTADVVKRFIFKHTSPHRCKFVELVHKQHVMVPSLFISHAHAASFAGLVTSIQRFCINNAISITSTAVFIDIFCLNAHSPGMLPECMDALQAMVASCQHVVLVVDHKGAAFSRLWCCYEAWLATLADRASVAAADAAAMPLVRAVLGRSRVDKLQVMFDCTDMEFIAHALTSPDTAHLYVTDPGDAKAIHAHAAACGHETKDLSSMVPALRAAILHVTRNNFLEASKSKDHHRSQYLESALYFANVLIMMKEMNEAEELMRQDIAWSKLRRPLFPFLLPMMNNLVVVLKGEGLMREAERICNQALALSWDLDSTLPSFAATKLPAMLASERLQLVDYMLVLNLEDIIFRNNQLVRAETMCRDLLKVGFSPRFKGMVARSISLPSCQLANLLMQRGEALKAEALLRDCVVAVTEADAASGMGEASLESALCRFALSMCLQACGQLTDACAMMEECTKTRCRILGSQSEPALEATTEHAGLLVATKQYDAAEALLESVYVTAESALGTQHAITRTAHGYMVNFLEAIVHLAQESHSSKVGAQSDFRLQMKEAEDLCRRALRVNTIVWSEASKTMEIVLLKELREVLRRQGKVYEVNQLTLQLQSLRY